MTSSVIVAGARTPIGKFGGGFKDLAAVDLGAAAIKEGIPKEIPSITINKVCLSGLNAIALADQLIRAGEIEIAIAGGMESMTNAPYAMPDARFGARMGNSKLVDLMVYD